MPPYKSPDPNTHDNLRFVRVYNDIFVGSTLADKHRDIVKTDQITDAVESTRRTEPAQVDAGFVGFLRDGAIIVDQRSDMLDLPVYGYTQEARKITLKCFQEQSPNRKVIGIERY